jgi:polyhydroxybutyrate depolymerase
MRTPGGVALPSLVVALGVPFWLACTSADPGDPSGAGGAAGTSANSKGGASNAGTSTSGGAGGSAGQGGSGTGGVNVGGASSGGAGAGGSAAAGSSTGGSSAAGSGTGGTPSGGSSSGGAGTGGSSGGTAGLASGGATAGGASGMSGASGGGAAGASSGGAAGAGASSGGSSAGSSGTAGAGGAAQTGSPGCGSATPLTSGTFMENIDGTNRRWMVDVPSGYDPDEKYKLIFVWHPLGGSGSQVASGGYNGIKSLSEGTTVFATADGLNGSNGEASGTGWWNANGGDMTLVQAMLDKINAGLCIDQDRIFSTGFSFGGMMSYSVGFQFDVFRAVAPCSGKTGVIPYENNNTEPLPIMAFHGDSDTFVQTELGKAFLDLYAERNNCGTQTQPVSPNGCVEYQGCDAPTTWCLFSGGHTTWSEEPAAIWRFFSQF